MYHTLYFVNSVYVISLIYTYLHCILLSILASVTVTVTVNFIFTLREPNVYKPHGFFLGFLATFICFCVTVSFYRSLYFVVNQIKLKLKLKVKVIRAPILYVIVSITKFSIVISHSSAYFSRNWRTITWVSNYSYPITTFCNWIPVIGHLRCARAI